MISNWIPRMIYYWFLFLIFVTIPEHAEGRGEADNEDSATLGGRDIPSREVVFECRGGGAAGEDVRHTCGIVFGRFVSQTNRSWFGLVAGGFLGETGIIPEVTVIVRKVRITVAIDVVSLAEDRGTIRVAGGGLVQTRVKKEIGMEFGAVGDFSDSAVLRNFTMVGESALGARQERPCSNQWSHSTWYSCKIN